MRKPLRLLLSVVLLAALTAGCSNFQPGVLTVVSTTTGAEALGSKMILVKKAATKTVSIPVVFGIPMGMVRDFNTIQSLLAENNADIATNMVITPRLTLALWLFGSYQVDITADLWRRADRASLDEGTATPTSHFTTSHWEGR